MRGRPLGYLVGRGGGGGNNLWSWAGVSTGQNVDGSRDRKPGNELSWKQLSWILCWLFQVRFYGAESSTEDEFHTKFPSLRNLDESKQIPQDDYVAMIADGLKLNKVNYVTIYLSLKPVWILMVFGHFNAKINWAFVKNFGQQKREITYILRLTVILRAGVFPTDRKSQMAFVISCRTCVYSVTSTSWTESLSCAVRRRSMWTFGQSTSSIPILLITSIPAASFCYNSRVYSIW